MTGDASAIGDGDGTNDAILFRVCAVASALMDGLEISSDDDFASLGIDSVAKLELLARIEREFQISVNEDRLVEFRSPGAVANLVRNVLEAPVREK